jgi:hypothetical protein
MVDPSGCFTKGANGSDNPVGQQALQHSSINYPNFLPEVGIICFNQQEMMENQFTFNLSQEISTFVAATPVDNTNSSILSISADASIVAPGLGSTATILEELGLAGEAVAETGGTAAVVAGGVGVLYLFGALIPPGYPGQAYDEITPESTAAMISGMAAVNSSLAISAIQPGSDPGMDWSGYHTSTLDLRGNKNDYNGNNNNENNNDNDKRDYTGLGSFIGGGLVGLKIVYDQFADFRAHPDRSTNPTNTEEFLPPPPPTNVQFKSHDILNVQGW